MAIDVNACIGCNACVVGCQAENNIPVVGKEQVARGPRDALAAGRQLLPRATATTRRRTSSRCRACTARTRRAKSVCPVGGDRAQRRRPERHGLQPLHRHALLLEQLPLQGPALQLPTSIRTGDTPEPASSGRNPDVTVRSRGVMEKCTYCVQRINAARDRERRSEGRRDSRRRDQDRVPAGVPDRGDRLRRPERRRRAVSRSCRPRPRNYALLAELNTRPRTTYLAAIRNPNPELG